MPGTAVALSFPTDLSDLEDQITELAAHIHAATFRLLELIREFDERQGWAGPGMLSCAHWLNWKCGVSLGAAREKVRVAHALKGLPSISAVFREGRVSYSKVRAMTRVATVENESYLLNIALHGTAAHVERLVSQYRKVKRIEALQEENRRHEDRELNWFVDEGGYWVIKGRFIPEQGALISKALEGAMDDAFSEQSDVSAETREPIAQRRADALERVAEAFINHKEISNKEGSRSGGDRYLIHVHTNRGTLIEDGESAEAEIEDIGRVSAETSRRMACDASVVRWKENENGEPLSIGRKSRTIPPALRRALRKRDRGCRFPGCTHRHYVDAHHIKHWADGGETSLNNLVLLFRKHHRLVHEGGYGLRITDEQGIEFSDSKGNIIPNAPAPRFRGNVEELVARNRQSGTQITPETSIPNWCGERMCDSMAVEGLYRASVQKAP